MGTSNPSAGTNRIRFFGLTIRSLSLTQMPGTPLEQDQT